MRREFLKISLLSLISLPLIKCKWDEESTFISNSSDMKCIGLIGGTSWHSTVDYYSYINQMVNEIKGERINPPLLLLNLNQRRINDLQAENKWEDIIELYFKACQKLVKAGVDALLLCSNTAHSVYDEISKAIDKPILHIADATGVQAKNLGLKNLGLLGTQYTMERPFIKERLKKVFDLEILLPEKSSHDDLMRIIYKELALGIIKPDSKEFVITEMNKLKDKGAEAVILACTEFPLLIKQIDYDLPIFNTTKLHCQIATDFIINQS